MVKGVSADNVTVKYGDGSQSAPSYAFAEAASERVFEKHFF